MRVWEEFINDFCARLEADGVVFSKRHTAYHAEQINLTFQPRAKDAMLIDTSVTNNLTLLGYEFKSHTTTGRIWLIVKCPVSVIVVNEPTLAFIYNHELQYPRGK
jgi:hypothetical protein